VAQQVARRELLVSRPVEDALPARSRREALGKLAF
jgi:hypothetical protein